MRKRPSLLMKIARAWWRIKTRCTVSDIKGRLVRPFFMRARSRAMFTRIDYVLASSRRVDDHRVKFSFDSSACVEYA